MADIDEVYDGNIRNISTFDDEDVAIGEDNSKIDITSTDDSDDVNINSGVSSVDEQAELSYEDAEKIKILRNVYIKLDGLPLSFGIPAYDDSIDSETIMKYFRTDLADTIRETGISIADIPEDSKIEMYFENRIVYHALKRFRMSATAFFKFSTAVDGKSIDKTQVPKMLAQLIAEYEEEYKTWRLGNIGKLWNMEKRSD